MDPITLLFASCLDAVSSIATQHTSDVLGTEVQALVVEHKGTKVPYAYQRWTIKPQSVCASDESKVAAYSRCTVAAKSLFADTCERLQSTTGDHWKHRKLKNMYCAAAVSYKPVIATIDWSPKSTPLEDARAECNAAIADLFDNPDPAAKKHKKTACGQYDALKVR
jgi:hypothetical protein